MHGPIFIPTSAPIPVDLTNHHNAALCPYCNPLLDSQHLKIGRLEREVEFWKAQAQGSRTPPAPAPQPVAWIVPASETMPYQRIERLVDVGQYPAGTKLYADHPPTASSSPRAPQAPTPEQP
jgi:hypothetical protein